MCELNRVYLFSPHGLLDAGKVILSLPIPICFASLTAWQGFMLGFLQTLGIISCVYFAIVWLATAFLSNKLCNPGGAVTKWLNICRNPNEPSNLGRYESVVFANCFLLSSILALIRYKTVYQDYESSDGIVAAVVFGFILFLRSSWD